MKHLHHKALDFDIGVYFEANGHGTVLYSPKAQEKIKYIPKLELSCGKRINNTFHLFFSKAAEASDNQSIKRLKTLMDMTNQCVGDAISDMLIVESILFAKGWNVQDWNEAYTDLPNRQMKVRVADRNVIKTTDAERKCVQPEGLQKSIGKFVLCIPCIC